MCEWQLNANDAYCRSSDDQFFAKWPLRYFRNPGDQFSLSDLLRYFRFMRRVGLPGRCNIGDQ